MRPLDDLRLSNGVELVRFACDHGLARQQMSGLAAQLLIEIQSLANRVINRQLNTALMRVRKRQARYSANSSNASVRVASAPYQACPPPA